MQDEVDYHFKVTKKSAFSEIVSWILTIVVCLALATFINNVIIVNARVPSQSMESTIMTGDRFIANRLAYTFNEPKFQDVIVFYAPDEPDTLFVKRVIGTEGDTVEIVDGVVYVNDVAIDEPYLNEKMNGSYGPYVVPNDSYFVLGDNRNHSDDSRAWLNTYVTNDMIVGQAMFTYLPKIKDID